MQRLPWQLLGSFVAASSETSIFESLEDAAV
jgi:hypothetical protein